MTSLDFVREPSEDQLAVLLYSRSARHECGCRCTWKIRFPRLTVFFESSYGSPVPSCMTHGREAVPPLWSIEASGAPPLGKPQCDVLNLILPETSRSGCV